MSVTLEFETAESTIYGPLLTNIRGLVELFTVVVS